MMFDPDVMTVLCHSLFRESEMEMTFDTRWERVSQAHVMQSCCGIHVVKRWMPGERRFDRQMSS
jgi:hypothetical protein